MLCSPEGRRGKFRATQGPPARKDQVYWHDDCQSRTEMRGHTRVARSSYGAQAWTGCRGVGQFVITVVGEAPLQVNTGPTPTCQLLHRALEAEERGEGELAQVLLSLQVQATHPSLEVGQCHDKRHRPGQAKRCDTAPIGAYEGFSEVREEGKTVCCL